MLCLYFKHWLTCSNLCPEPLLQSADQSRQDVHPQQNHLRGGKKYMIQYKIYIYFRYGYFDGQKQIRNIINPPKCFSNKSGSNKSWPERRIESGLQRIMGKGSGR